MKMATVFMASLLLATAAVTGCADSRVVSLGANSIVVTRDWHDYARETQVQDRVLALRRAGIPFFEPESILSFWHSADPGVNTSAGALAWQDKMMARQSFGVDGSRKRETLQGKYTLLCVSADKGRFRLLNCDVIGAPLRLSFAGSPGGEAQVREMLGSLQ